MGAEMDSLTIPRGKDTLGVVCDPARGAVEFEGSSFPEDAFLFFEPVVSWVETYLASAPAKLHIICTIDYLSSSSSKSLFDLFDLVSKESPDGCDTLVVWRFDTDDPDTRDVGEEFAEDVDVPFRFESAR